MNNATGNPLGSLSELLVVGSAGVASPDLHTKLGPKLTSPAGKPTTLAHAIYIVLLTFPMVLMLNGSATVLSAPASIRLGPLYYHDAVFRIGLAMCETSWALAFHSLRDVTRAGGALEQLNAGTAPISIDAHASLRRWARGLTAFGVTFLALITVIFRNGLLGEGNDEVTKAISEGGYTSSPLWNVASSVMVLAIFYAGVSAAFLLWYSLKIAAAIGTEVVREAAHEVKLWPETKESVGAENANNVWRERVVHRALEPARRTMPLISQGWGPGLGGLALGFWAWAAAIAMVLILPSAIPTILAMPVVMLMAASVPLLLAFDPAHTSSQCDKLVEGLNNLVVIDLDDDKRVDPIIRALQRRNKNQGVGFVVFGLVVDKRVLRNVAVGMYSLMATVLPIMLGLAEVVDDLEFRPSSNSSVCGMSAAEADALGAVLPRLLQNSTSCSYNISLSVGPTGVIVN